MSGYGLFARVGVHVDVSHGIRCQLDAWEPVDAGSVAGANFAARSSGRTHTVTANVPAGGRI
ncbi:hypothetical protein GCM10010448_70960 [Streptomyces glomeratus]|uniref:Uncharacterized protein n=1 Tax=Streptomyces glomeratus TaxID=284452 RepID=A0ABP6M9G1_9ACTN